MKPLSKFGSQSRYSYRPITEEVNYKWPKGKGLAVYLAVNLEVYDLNATTFDTLVPNSSKLDLINYCWLDWGNRVGAWRLLEAINEYKIPTTALINTNLYSARPGLVDAWRSVGCEIAAHGRTNGETQANMSEQEETKLISEVTASITENEGIPPKGWLGPWLAETPLTLDLLAEAGYEYVLDWCADDRPFFMNTRRGKILSVPYPLEANDANAIAVRGSTATEFTNLCLAQIDEMMRQAENGPIVSPIALHPHIIAQAHRLHEFRNVLARLAELREELWLTCAKDIASVVCNESNISE